jgi:putative transposase
VPRMPRIVIPGVPHHVTQRGNRREDVFFVRADYRRYLRLLGEYAGERGLEILAYCLMPNHVHLVVVPADASSLAAVLKPVHLRYAQYVNRSQECSGRVWQGRFYSCPLDGAHTSAALRYVECNPVRAGLEPRAVNYEWSSAASHTGLRRDRLLVPDIDRWVSVDDWSAWLGETEADDLVTRLRLYTRTGRPLGDKGFVKKLERESGRRLHALPVGRPEGRSKNG